MTNNSPKTTTITKTVKGVTAFIEHSTDTQLTPMPQTQRPYVLESGEFDAFVLGKRRLAEREIQDIDDEIGRLHIEIESRMQRRQDLMGIIFKADAALTTDISQRPSPKFVDKAETAE